MRPPLIHAALLLAAFSQLGRCDLPVHCLRHQVAGDWDFELGPASAERSSCGHQRPDSPHAQPSFDIVAQAGPTSTVRLSLEDPSTVSARDGSETGSWTMIYDEAFQVAMGDKVFVAFSNFKFVDDPVKGRTNVSLCDGTQVGWYHNAARTEWGCFVGRKTGSASSGAGAAASPPERPTRAAAAPSSLADLGSRSGFLSPAEKDTRLAETPDDYRPWVPTSAGYDQPMPNDWQRAVADALNFLQLGWRAEPFHKFVGKTPRELNYLAGSRHSRPSGYRPSGAASFASFLGLHSRVRRASRARGNDALDWRDRQGTNWLQPVVTQGDCGSCYTISTVHMLTARHRIAKGDANLEPFSVSFPLYCSEYNQGCDGGYGFLQAKWSEDVGIVPERCSPFSTGGGSCSALKDCDLGAARYRAVNHHYVGGYYGASDEASIKQELTANGPVVMSFEPKEDFMYYKRGVYVSAPNKIHQEWEQVDHAVLLVGFGSELGQPYWTMQNSWGEDWGESGFFRMARGSDESGCESIVVAAEVVEEASNDVLDRFLAAL